ncbi:MAG: RluA family pseudouridine synthase [Wenzhouxiangellaceae bacterium]|nr:RluA family pseudouridine synthase [Wenzhouxiangellaceae bacterium]MBS3746953.1 RluA family pseudouridine synthase [Wenzhouxiangellaceae bacterium]MBS3823435.1 RluA family pseudouridine synthase [Wenzhouxiangellaceae bacterium]
MSESHGSVREVVVDPDHGGQRLDNFLSRELGQVPRSLVYRLIRTGQVRINGGRVKPMRKLRAGDRVRIPPVRASGPRRAEVPEDRVAEIRQRILHRQKEFLLVDKPSGLASQAGTGLAWGLNDVMQRIDARATPVHRLDRETSGLMLFALGAASARELQRLFRRGEIEKRYLALLDGHLDQPRVDVDLPLKKIRDGSGQHRVITAEDGQPARSSFRRLERLARHDFVDVRIATGRTHQIRVHAQSLGAPVAGDRRYNSNPSPAGLERLFLHAGYLRLAWPEDQVFSSPLPEELNLVLERLR